ncbi:MAG: RHS repeat-associated core domain-containing protein [Bacteroidota bacterium]
MSIHFLDTVKILDQKQSNYVLKKPDQSSFAIGFSMLDEKPFRVQLASMELSYDAGKLMIRGDQASTFSQDIKQLPDNWLILKIGTTTIIYGDGLPIYSLKMDWSQSVYDLKFETVGKTNPSFITNRFYGLKPVTEQSYTNGLGKVIQRQHFIFNKEDQLSGKLVEEIIYDGWGNAEIQTLPGPMEAKQYRYEAAFVEGFDRGNGRLEGVIKDYYTQHPERNQNVDDPAYAYTWHLHEKSPLSRIVGVWYPGKAFHLISQNQTSFKYQDQNGRQDLSRMAIPENLLNEFSTATSFHPNGHVETQIHDQFGRLISINHGGALTKNEYTYTDLGYPLHRTLQPKHFSPDSSQFIAKKDWYTNKVFYGDLLGQYVTDSDVDGGATTVLNDHSGLQNFLLRSGSHYDDYQNKIPLDISINWAAQSGENLLQIRNVKTQKVEWRHADPNRPFNGENGRYAEKLRIYLEPGQYELETVDSGLDGWSKDSWIHLSSDYINVLDTIYHDDANHQGMDIKAFELSLNPEENQVSLQIRWPKWAIENQVFLRNADHETIWEKDIYPSIFFRHKFDTTFNIPPGKYYVETHDFKNDGWNKKGNYSVAVNDQVVLDKVLHKATRKKNGFVKFLEEIFLGTYFRDRYLQNPRPQITSFQVKDSYPVAIQIDWPQNTKDYAIQILNNTNEIEKELFGDDVQAEETDQYLVFLEPGTYTVKTIYPNTNGRISSGSILIKYHKDTLLDQRAFRRQGLSTTSHNFTLGKKLKKPQISTRTKKEFTYTKYDQLGRPIEAGMLFKNFDRALLETMAYSDFWKDYDAQMRKTWKYNIREKDQSSLNYKGRLSEATFIQEDHQTTESYVYDTRGHITELSQLIQYQDGRTYERNFKYEYSLDGKVKKIHYPDGTTVTHTYDQLGRLKQVGSGTVSNAFGQYTYTWDGKIQTTETNQQKVKESRAYDLNGHLTQKSYSAMDITLFQEDLAYFLPNGKYLNGNIVQKSESGTLLKDNKKHDYSYDAKFQLTNWKEQGKRLKNDVDYTYDANGNLKLSSNAKGKTQQHFNYQQGTNLLQKSNEVRTNSDGQVDRLNTPIYGASDIVYDPFTLQAAFVQSANNRQQKIQYIYNPSGKRMAKLSYNGNAKEAAVTRTYFHGQHHLPLLEEVASSTLRRTQKMVYGLEYGPLMGEAQEGDNTQNYHFIRDHLGSVRYILSADNLVLESFEYTVNGVTTMLESRSLDFNYLYTGQEYEAELGWYNYKARFYKPAWSRFLSIDPIRSQISPYIYVENNPVNFVDETGLVKTKPPSSISSKLRRAKNSVRGISKRLLYMGSTPNKISRTGRAVIQRWEGKGKANYKGKLAGLAKYKDLKNWEVHVKVGGVRTWKALDRNIHMGHIISAAGAWTTGVGATILRDYQGKASKYFTRYSQFLNKSKALSTTGRKSKLIRDFMKYPENYRLEWGPDNMRAGSGKMLNSNGVLKRIVY